jgi:hypothetical protein
VHVLFRCSLIAAIIATLACAPLVSYGADNPNSLPPAVTVTQASSALLDHAIAAVGSTVYPGDTLETDPTGSLRLRSHEAQLYMLSDSITSLEDSDAGWVRASLVKGTAGFASGASDRVEIDTADAVIRSRAGVPTHGRITVVKPGELLVSSISGPFDITVDGATQTIADGQSYRALITEAKDPFSEGGTGVEPTVRSHRRLLKLILISAGIAIAIGLGFYINHVLCESPHDP